MPEMNTAKPVRKIRHRGRTSQISIYLGKQIRFFINQNDWKVLPMAAIIAAMVAMVIRNKIFVNMEGSLMGAFALTCLAIWNGCFNSIQAVCRERPIIKREHRSGMHITSYVVAHMIYQLALCLAQTALTLYMLILMGVKFPAQGMITPWLVADVGISMLLISYASDMLSLFISSISHTTTSAMTVMPFVLIFQLIFSGGIIPLPQWSKAISNFTISNYGINVLTAQTDYNNLPMVAGWNILDKTRDNEIGGSVTVGQLIDLLGSPALEKRRDTEVLKSYTVGEVADILNSAEPNLHLRDRELTHPVAVGTLLNGILTNEGLKELREHEIIPADGETPAVTVGSVITAMLADEELKPLMAREVGTDLTLGQVLDALHTKELVSIASDHELNPPVTLGDIIDFAQNNEALQVQRDRKFTFKTTVGELFELFGEENVKELVERKSAQVSQKAAYENSVENIVNNWITLGVFVIVFALLAIVALELIDKDKR